MRCTTSCTAGCMLLCLSLFCSSCYESMDPQPPAAQAPQPASEAGPITEPMSQGGGSALGGAKKAATNVVEQAQQASEQAAKDAGLEDVPPVPPVDDEP